MVGLFGLLIESISTSSTLIPFLLTPPGQPATIAYSFDATACDVAQVSTIVAHMSTQSRPPPQFVFVPLPDLMDSFISNSTNTTGGIIFHTVDSMANTFNATLMYNSESSWVPALPALLSSFLSSVQLLLTGVQPGSPAASEVPRGSFLSLPGASLLSQTFPFYGPILITYGLLFVIPTFTYNVVLEKEKMLKQQLILTGVSPRTYWLALLIGDFIQFLVVIGLVIGTLLAFQVTAFTDSSFLSYFLLFCVYGLNSVAIAMLFSFFFDKSDTASRSVSILVTLLYLIPYLIMNIGLNAGSDPKPISEGLYLAFSVLPTYALNYGLDLLAKADSTGQYISTREMFYWGGEEGLAFGRKMGALLLLCVVEFAALLALVFALEEVSQRRSLPPRVAVPPAGNTSSSSHQYPISPNAPLIGPSVEHGIAVDVPSEGVENESQRLIVPSLAQCVEDDDVLREQTRVPACADALRIYGIRKTYPLTKKERLKRQRPLNEMRRRGVPISPEEEEESVHKVAVRGLTLGIPVGECFGLLGPNGAGKSTLIGCLTGSVPATSGEAVLMGHSLFHERPITFSNVGVCAQFDRLWQNMTAREHLYLFAWLRGIPKHQRNDTVLEYLTKFDIVEHADKEISALSGGTKRKLSVALSFIGEPQVVFLDEPSTGMDPKARRTLWDQILGLQRGRVIILTTHFMEECDALCSRIGIMVNGRMCCLGSSQHLKAKYGGGYRLSLTAVDQTAVRGILQFVEEHFPGALIQNQVGCVAHFEVAKSFPLSHMFETVEANKAALGITDYSISQTTLEQVFLNFAKTQKEEDRIS